MFRTRLNNNSYSSIKNPYIEKSNDSDDWEPVNATWSLPDNNEASAVLPRTSFVIRRSLYNTTDKCMVYMYIDTYICIRIWIYKRYFKTRPPMSFILATTCRVLSDSSVCEECWQASRTWTSDYIPQYLWGVRCNYMSVPLIPASGTTLLIWQHGLCECTYGTSIFTNS